MKRRDEKPSQQIDPSSEGEERDLGEAAHELELDSANLRLSAAEKEAVRQGIDTAKVGSFAPQDEMDEFYRIHRDA